MYVSKMFVESTCSVLPEHPVRNEAWPSLECVVHPTTFHLVPLNFEYSA